MSLEVQAQIRRNAEEIQSYVSDLKSWEQSVKRKDTNLRQSSTSGTARPVRGGGTVPVRSGYQYAPPVLSTAEKKQAKKKKKKSNNATPQSGSSASHTYDKGYKKWSDFDIDKALEEVDSKSSDEDEGEEDEEETEVAINSGAPVAPFTVAGAVRTVKRKMVARPRNTVRSDKPREELEKENGNEYYKKGEFAEAVKCYTRAVALAPRNPIFLSNRSMAYLKLKEYRKAESDATLALRLCPQVAEEGVERGPGVGVFVKSLSRRASARGAQGRHLAALSDLRRAALADPCSRALRVELRKARDLMRAAVRRAPSTPVPLSIPAVGTAAEKETPTAAAAPALCGDGPAAAAAAAVVQVPPVAPGEVVLGPQLPGEAGRGDVSDDFVMVPPSSAAKPTSPSSSAGVVSLTSSATSSPAASAVTSPSSATAAAGGSPAAAAPQAAGGGDTAAVVAAVEEEVAATAPKDRQAVVEGALRKVADRQRTAKASKKAATSTLPRTGYELTRTWTSPALAHSLDARAEYLLSIPVARLRRLLAKGSVEPEQIGEIAVVAASALSSLKPTAALAVLQTLAGAPRFAVAAAFLTDDDKQALVRCCEELLVQGAATDGVVATLKADYLLL